MGGRERELTCKRGRGIVQGIRDKIEKATIDISLKCSNAKCRENRKFQQEPGPRLIKECDERSKEIQRNVAP